VASLALWIAAGLLALVLPSLGMPFPWSVVVASPFAFLAGWQLHRARRPHRCGWCGRRFGGPHEWCCPDCEGAALGEGVDR
jgi:hypothetical protein